MYARQPSQAQQEIFKSPVVAKSYLKTHKTMVSFHQGSTGSHAYFVSHAESENADPASWTLKWSSPAGMNGATVDYWAFVNSLFARLSGNKIVFIKTIYAASLSDFVDMVNAVKHDYNIHAPVFTKRMSRQSWEKSFSTPEIKDNDHVLYYVDYCEKCGTSHRMSHYPEGKVICEDYDSIRNNPNLYYKYHKNGTFYFGFAINK